MTKRRKVLVACCNGTARIHKLVVMAAIRMLQDRRHEVRFIMPTHSPLVNNQHKVVEDFLKEGHDFLLFMDDDNPPINNPIDLVELNKDVIGLPTPVWNSGTPGDVPYYFNIMREVPSVDENGEPFIGWRPLNTYPGFEAKGLKKADAVGGGCVLIARRVLLKLISAARDNVLEMPFMRRWDSKTGQVTMGNDFAFCQRARRHGFKVWAHFDYQCRHYNTMDIMETVNAMTSIKSAQSGVF